MSEWRCRLICNHPDSERKGRFGLKLADFYGQALTHTKVLLPDSLRNPLFAASLLSTALITPSVCTDLTRTRQASLLCSPDSADDLLCEPLSW